jgi:hypothetical protein
VLLAMESCLVGASGVVMALLISYKAESRWAEILNHEYQSTFVVMPSFRTFLSFELQLILCSSARFSLSTLWVVTVIVHLLP